MGKERMFKKQKIFGMKEERQVRAVVLKPGCRNELTRELLVKTQVSGLFHRLYE